MAVYTKSDPGYRNATISAVPTPRTYSPSSQGILEVQITATGALPPVYTPSLRGEINAQIAHPPTGFGESLRGTRDAVILFAIPSTRHLLTSGSPRPLQRLKLPLS